MARIKKVHLKPSGWGRIVDKSKATKTVILGGTTFPQGSKYNYTPKYVSIKQQHTTKNIVHLADIAKIEHSSNK